MIRTLPHIALTYFRPMFLLPIGFGLLIFRVATADNMIGGHLLLLIPLAFLASYLMIHVKEQMATPRARTLPRYRLPHLLVALTGSAALIPLLSWAALNSRATFPGLLALFSFTFVFVAWLQLRNSYLLWLAIPAFFFLFSTPVRDLILQLSAGERPTAAIVLLVASVAGLLAMGVRLMRMNEETDEYHNVADMNPWSARSRQERLQWKSSKAFGPEWLSRILSGSNRAGPIDHSWGTSLWARAKLWRLGMGTMSPAVVSLLFVAVVLVLGLVSLLIEPERDRAAPNTPADNLLVAVFVWCCVFGSLFTTTSAARGWIRRLSRVGCESLRPVSRRRFVHEIGLAFTIDMWTPWAVFNCAFFAATAVMRPDLLISGMWYLLLWSASFYLLAYSLTAYLSIFRSAELAVGVIVTAFIVFIIGSILINVRQDTSGVLPAFAVGASICLALVAYSYHYWCNADLD